MVSYYINTPMSWDKIITYDAYVNYKLTDDASIELTGTNLSNLYYIDPLTRSAVPAPCAGYTNTSSGRVKILLCRES